MEWDITKKLWGIILDNASTNDAMVNILADSDVIKGRFEGSLSRIRCFGHIMNLKFQAALLELRHEPEREKHAKATPPAKQQKTKRTAKRVEREKNVESEDESEDEIDTSTPLEQPTQDDDLDKDSSRVLDGIEIET